MSFSLVTTADSRLTPSVGAIITRLLAWATSKAGVFEVTERNHDYSHIVKSPSQQTILQNVLHAHSTLLVYIIGEI